MTLFSQPLVLIFFLLTLVFCAFVRFFRKSWFYLPAGIFGVGLVLAALVRGLPMEELVLLLAILFLENLLPGRKGGGS